MKLLLLLLLFITNTNASLNCISEDLNVDILCQNEGKTFNGDECVYTGNSIACYAKHKCCSEEKCNDVKTNASNWIQEDTCLPKTCNMSMLSWEWEQEALQIRNQLLESNNETCVEILLDRKKDMCNSYVINKHSTFCMGSFKPRNRRQLKEAVDSCWNINNTGVNCTKNGIHISKWDVSNIQNMSYLFSNDFDYESIFDHEDEFSDYMYKQFPCESGRPPGLGGKLSPYESDGYCAGIGGPFLAGDQSRFVFDPATTPKIFNGNISSWDVSNVKDMNVMFLGTDFNGDISSWNVSNVETMMGTFFLSNFNGNISSWDVSNVKYMIGTFGWSDFNGDIGSWDVSNVQHMSAMFTGSMFNRNINSWDVRNVKGTGGMFANAFRFNQPLNNWNVSSLVMMWSMFRSSSEFNQPLDKWKFSKNVSLQMRNMFGYSNFNNNISTWFSEPWSAQIDIMFHESTFNSDISSWDVSNVYYVDSVFERGPFNGNLDNWVLDNPGASYTSLQLSPHYNGSIKYWKPNYYSRADLIIPEFFNGDISSWDVSDMTDMSSLFMFRTYFNGDISSWDVSKVTDMSGMFEDAVRFNGDISSWDVSNVTDMSDMFYNAKSFNQNLSSWDVSKVTDMSKMFEDADRFNQDLSSWNVSNVTDMSSMFKDADRFNRDNSPQTFMTAMQQAAKFKPANKSELQQALNGCDYGLTPDNCTYNTIPIEDWDVSGISDMSELFKDTLFNYYYAWSGPLSKWNVSGVTNMTNIFENSNIFWYQGSYDPTYPISWDCNFDESVTKGNVCPVWKPESNAEFHKALLVCKLKHHIDGMNKISGLNFYMGDIYNGLRNNIYRGVGEYIWKDKEDRRKLLDLANFRKDEDFCIKNNSPISNWDVSNVDNMAYAISCTGTITAALKFVIEYTVKLYAPGISQTFDELMKLRGINPEYNSYDLGLNTDGTFGNATVNDGYYEKYIVSYMYKNPIFCFETENVWGSGRWGETTQYMNGVGCINTTVPRNVRFDVYYDALFNNIPIQGVVSFEKELENLNPNIALTKKQKRMLKHEKMKWLYFLMSILYEVPYTTTDAVIKAHEILNDDNQNELILSQINPEELEFLLESNAPTDYYREWWRDEMTLGNEMTLIYRGLQEHDYRGRNEYLVRRRESLMFFEYLSAYYSEYNSIRINISETDYGWTTPSHSHVKVSKQDFVEKQYIYSRFNFNSDARPIVQIYEKCNRLPVNLKRWNVSSVNNMKGMFYSDIYNVNRTIGNMNSWNVENVKDMAYMFSGVNISSSSISSWNVSNVKNMTGMFLLTSFNNNGNMNSWKLNSVTEVSYMFFASSFNSDISTWNFPNANSIEHIFNYAWYFNGDISSWDVSSVTNMSYAFHMARSFNGDLNSWDVSNVEDMSDMFSNAISFNGDLNSWDVSNVEDMSDLFYYTYNFNKPLDKWNVSNVKNMKRMFMGSGFWSNNSRNASSVSTYKQTRVVRDLNSWDVSNVEDMTAMFSDSRVYHNINEWDVSNVKDMKGMFYTALLISDISKWNVSNVKDMTNMFYNTIYDIDNPNNDFNGDFTSWDVSNVEDMSNMFNSLERFVYHTVIYPTECNRNLRLSDAQKIVCQENPSDVYVYQLSIPPLDWSKINISTWNVSKVKNMCGMLAGTNITGVKNWDVSNVLDMAWMFVENDAEHDLSKWDTRHNPAMQGMFFSGKNYNGSLIRQHYKKLGLKSWFTLREINHGAFLGTPSQASVKFGRSTLLRGPPDVTLYLKAGSYYWTCMRGAKRYSVGDATKYLIYSNNKVFMLLTPFCTNAGFNPWGVEVYWNTWNAFAYAQDKY